MKIRVIHAIAFALGCITAATAVCYHAFQDGSMSDMTTLEGTSLFGGIILIIASILDPWIPDQDD